MSVAQRRAKARVNAMFERERRRVARMSLDEVCAEVSKTGRRIRTLQRDQLEKESRDLLARVGRFERVSIPEEPKQQQPRVVLANRSGSFVSYAPYNASFSNFSLQPYNSINP